MVEQKWCIVEYGHFVQKIQFENMGFGCVNVQTKPHHQVINRTAVRFILYIYSIYIYIPYASSSKTIGSPKSTDHQVPF